MKTPRMLEDFNRRLLVAGVIAALAVWVVAFCGLISAKQDVKGEALVCVIAWPFVYTVALLFLSAILRLLSSELATKVFGQHKMLVGVLSQVCVLLGLPCTLLFEMISGIFGKG